MVNTIGVISGPFTSVVDAKLGTKKRYTIVAAFCQRFANDLPMICQSGKIKLTCMVGITRITDPTVGSVIKHLL